MAQQERMLRRSREDRFLFGVAGGFAEYFAVDPFLIRVGWVLLTIATAGVAALMYVVLASIIPIGGRRVAEEVKASDGGDSARPESGIKIRFNVVRGAIGTAIIAIGMIILLEQLSVLSSIRWDIVFPSTIILLGVTALVPSIVVGLNSGRQTNSTDESSGDDSESTEAVAAIESPPKRHVARNVVGIGLIVVGMTSLLTELRVIETIRWDIVWPLAIVAVGVLVLLPLLISIRR